MFDNTLLKALQSYHYGTEGKTSTVPRAGPQGRIGNVTKEQGVSVPAAAGLARSVRLGEEFSSGIHTTSVTPHF